MINILTKLTDLLVAAEKKTAELLEKESALLRKQAELTEQESGLASRRNELAEQKRKADERDRVVIDIDKARKDNEAQRVQNQQDRKKIVDDGVALKEAQDLHAQKVNEFEQKQASDAEKLAKEWRIIEDKKKKIDDEIVKRVQELMSKIKKEEVA